MDVEVSSKKLHQPIAHSFKIQCTICISNQMLYEFAPFWNIDCKILLPRINMNMPLPDFAEFRPTFNLGLTQMCISNQMLFKFAHFLIDCKILLLQINMNTSLHDFDNFSFNISVSEQRKRKKNAHPSLTLKIPFHLWGIHMHYANPMTWASCTLKILQSLWHSRALCQSHDVGVSPTNPIQFLCAV